MEVDYLSALLEGNSPDPMSARRVLDSLEEDRLRLYVCESVLEQRVQEVVRGPLSHVETIIFILHYVLSELDGSLGEAKRVKYINWLLGAKVRRECECECKCECKCEEGSANVSVREQKDDNNHLHCTRTYIFSDVTMM